MRKLLFDKLGVLVSSDGTLYTVETLKKFIDYAAELDYNIFYIDLTAGYELEGEPLFCYLRAKYSNTELKELDAYAKSKGITVIPTIQTLAHLGYIFRWRPYFGMRDIDDILLVGEPKVYEFIEKMIKTMSECFSAKIIHLGLDEAFRLGRGKYYDLHGDRNRVDIMKEHVDKVLEICKKYGVSAEVWGDMYIRLAYGTYDEGGGTQFDKSEEVANSIDAALKIHYWDYYGLDVKHYSDYIDKFKKLTDNVVFDGGVQSYIGFEPDNTFSIRTLEAGFKASYERGIKEVTVTIWGGDVTNETSLWATMPSVVAASEFAHGNYDMVSVKAKFKQLMGMDFDAFIALESADKLKARDKDNKESYYCNPTKYLLYNDVFAGVYDSTVDESERRVFTEAAKQLKPYVGDKRWGGIFRTAKALAEVLEYKFDLGIRTRRAYQAGDKKELKNLANKVYPLVIKRVKKLYRAFREQYYAECKYNGFEVQDMRFGGLINRLQNCRELLLKYCGGKIERLNELEQKIVDYFDGSDDLVNGALFENGYVDEVSSLPIWV